MAGALVAVCAGPKTSGASLPLGLKAAWAPAGKEVAGKNSKDGWGRLGLRGRARGEKESEAEAGLCVGNECGLRGETKATRSVRAR
eukprot:6114472-Pleurochrysis_carterae.AAC.2